MKKILFIDPIDKGYRNFLRLNNQFVKKNYETLLVHTTSFHHKIKEKETTIETLRIRDISYYKTNLIRKVIEKENPSIILIINLSFVFDRAIVNIAKKNNIKIVYLAHGSLTNPALYETARAKLDKQIKENISRIFSRKNFWGLINYLDSQKYGKKCTSFFQLISGIIRHASEYLTLPKFDKELDADLLLVYENKDKELLSVKMGFPHEKIIVVGNPEISLFIHSPLLEKEKFLSKIGVYTQRYAVYLDDGLVANKIWSKEEWYNHLLSIINILKDNGITLVIKLHPRTEISEHTSFFNNYTNNIVAVEDSDFKNLLYHCDFVISMYSSTIIYALLLHKKVFIPKWDNSCIELTNKYPDNIVTYCFSMNEFKNLIASDHNDVDTTNVDHYLKNNGIKTDINSICYIVDVINNLYLSLSN